MTTNIRHQKRNRRHNRIRAKVVGTTSRPRLAVFRSNTNIYAQLIDDSKGATIAAASSLKGKKMKMTEAAAEVGKAIAAQAKERGVTQAVFDRGGFLYAGVIKAVADGAREGGLEM